MSTNSNEEQAREAAHYYAPTQVSMDCLAYDEEIENAENDFTAGYLAAAAPREELIAELVATLSQARAWIRGANEPPILSARINAALAKAENR